MLLMLVVWSRPVRSQSELELIDGRILTGTSVRRDGAQYLLEQENGTVIPVPVELVARVRLIVEGDPDREDPNESTQVAGAPVKVPDRNDQLGVFDHPSEFQEDVVDHSWAPSSDWNMDPATQNNFAPSEWQEDVVDHSWEPTSAWDKDEDVLADSRSSWQKSSIDSSWTPTSGFD